MTKTIKLQGILITALLCIFIFSCKKETSKKSIVSFEELNKMYSQASIQLQNLHLEKSQTALTSESNQTNSSSVTSTFTEEEATDIIQPLIDPTSSYLSQNYDVNIYEFFPVGDPRIALIGSAALRLDALEMNNMTVDTNSIGTIERIFEVAGTPSILDDITSADDDNNWYDCGLRSLGIDAAVTLFQGGFSSAVKSSMKKSALRKMIIKVASRTLSWVGAAVAVYEFGDCMDWW